MENIFNIQFPGSLDKKMELENIQVSRYLCLPQGIVTLPQKVVYLDVRWFELPPVSNR